MNDAINQDRPPNFRDGDRLFLVRCYRCEPERGRENYALAVAGGFCARCGWGMPESAQVDAEVDAEKEN